MRQKPNLKPVVWIGSSREDLRGFPEDVQDKIGRALLKVQYGSKPVSAKILSGFHGASVLEIKADHDSDTYRAVYTVQFAEQIYVLHTFQKKSKRGIETPRQDMDLIHVRLKRAEAMHQELLAAQMEKPQHERK